MYPSRKVKAEFARCPISNRLQVFKESKCILPISVGQQLSVHEGEKFFVTIKLVERSFSECTILIDDSIQRYTFALSSNDNEQELWAKSIAEGDIWLHNNKETLSSIKIPHKIMRWDDWLAHKSYPKHYTAVSELYKLNTSYNQAFHISIQEFVSRYCLRKNFKITSNTYDLCLRYLLEECSVMCLWAEEGYDFEVYPSGRNFAMSETYEVYIKKNYPNKLMSVSLNFKKKNEQKFIETEKTI